MSFQTPGVNDQFPGGGKAGLGRLILPKLYVKGSIQFLNSSSTHHYIRLHDIFPFW